MSPSVSVVSWPPFPPLGWRAGMRWRMVIFSGPTRTSWTTARRTRWRSSVVAVAELARSFSEEALEVVGELQVGVAVGGLGGEGGDMVLLPRLAGAQV